MSSRLCRLAVVLAAACGDNAAPPGAVAPDASAPTAAYLVGTRVWDDTTTTSYFHVVSSLDAAATVNQARALETPGSAKLFAIGDAWFGIGGGEAPTITRYTLDGSDRLVARET